MKDTGRRRLLRSVGAVTVAAIAGCVTSAGRPETESPERPKETIDDDGSTNDDGSLTEWERSTDCEGEHDGMYDSVLRVERVASSLGDEYVPVRFTDLTPEERTILQTVTEDGGYGTCDASGAFRDFVDRVADAADRQDGDRMRVYLEREDTYYGLYVEVQDQVFAY